MDLYAKNEKLVYELKQTIVNDIITVLKEKGYEYGDKGTLGCFYDELQAHFELEKDRLIIDDHHTDYIGIDNLMRYLRAAYHTLPKE